MKPGTSRHTNPPSYQRQDEFTLLQTGEGANLNFVEPNNQPSTQSSTPTFTFESVSDKNKFKTIMNSNHAKAASYLRFNPPSSSDTDTLNQDHAIWKTLKQPLKLSSLAAKAPTIYYGVIDNPVLTNRKSPKDEGEDGDSRKDKGEDKGAHRSSVKSIIQTAKKFLGIAKSAQTIHNEYKAGRSIFTPITKLCSSVTSLTLTFLSVFEKCNTTNWKKIKNFIGPITSSISLFKACYENIQLYKRNSASADGQQQTTLEEKMRKENQRLVLKKLIDNILSGIGFLTNLTSAATLAYDPSSETTTKIRGIASLVNATLAAIDLAQDGAKHVGIDCTCLNQPKINESEKKELLDIYIANLSTLSEDAGIEQEAAGTMDMSIQDNFNKLNLYENNAKDLDFIGANCNRISKVSNSLELINAIYRSTGLKQDATQAPTQTQIP